MQLTFIASIALNLLLLTSLVAARVDPSRAGTGPHDAYTLALPGPESAETNDAIGTAQELVEALSETRLGPDAIRVLTLSWLEHHALAAPLEPRVPYWQPEFSPLLEELVGKAGAEATARNELLAIFGREAAADPVFARVFRPLGAGYAFLGSEAQIALQQYQIEHLQAATATAAPGFAPRSCVGRATAGGADPRGHASVPSGFSAAEAREYQLRYSPLAAQLRAVVRSATEQEFRALFDLLLELENRAAPRDQARLRHALRERMGSNAFDHLQSMRDPFFVEYQAYLRGQGFGDGEVAAAYAILNQSQDQLLEILGRDPAGEGAMALLGRVRESELEKLTQLLGTNAARGLGLVRRQALSEKMGGSLPAC
jgi:hypothetical protein